MSPTGRRAQLDGVRAFAVAGVVACHYFVPRYGILAFGGVKLFFVLSGFLITGLLLAARDQIEDGRCSTATAFVRFYMRRATRIFPLYYAVVAVALLIGLPPARDLGLWLLSYTLNFHMLQTGWFVDRFAHFWSLAVEEQFYLVWPIAILATPRRWLLPITLACIAAGPLWRGYVVYGSPLGTYIAPLACLDSLGLGALLALALHASRTPPVLRTLCAPRVLLGVGGSLVLVLLFLGPLWVRTDVMLFDFALSLGFCGATRLAWEGAPGLVGRILSLGPIVYVGQVSYGIYVLHPFAFDGVRAIASRLSAPARDDVVGVVAIAVCLGAAALSWHWFERPLNELRNHPRWQPR
jgi:peptidoglycan/LPS O-acetylase OafA/YrhL